MRVAAIVIAATFTLVGCSANTDSGSRSSTPAAPSSSPSANILDSAIEATASRGTAALTISIDATDLQIIGSGSASFANGRGEIEWTNQGTSETWTDLINSDGTFTRVDQSWFLAPAGTQTPTSASIFPLSQIASVVTNNDDPLTGTAPLTIDSGMNFSDEEITELARTCDMNIKVDVFLDSVGLISSISKSFDCPGNERTSTTELSDFGSPVNLSTPQDAFEIDPNQ
jgi:hypothetical protein